MEDNNSQHVDLSLAKDNDKALNYIGEYQDHHRSGVGASFNEKGEIEYIGEWLNDLRTGIGISFNEKGEIECIEERLNDLPTGISICFHANGEIKSITMYHRCIKYYDNGCRNGIINTKHTQSEIYRRHNGSLQYRGQISRDKDSSSGELLPNGIGTYFHSNGSQSMGEFHNNKMNGPGIRCDRDKRITAQGTYNADELFNGTKYKYEKNQTQEYKEGKKIAVRTMTEDDKRKYENEEKEEEFIKLQQETREEEIKMKETVATLKAILEQSTETIKGNIKDADKIIEQIGIIKDKTTKSLNEIKVFFQNIIRPHMFKMQFERQMIEKEINPREIEVFPLFDISEHDDYKQELKGAFTLRCRKNSRSKYEDIDMSEIQPKQTNNSKHIHSLRDKTP